jgi:hypothetical protein
MGPTSDSPSIGRRGFLKLTALAGTGLAMAPSLAKAEAASTEMGRVTVSWIGLYSEPSFRSRRLAEITRDELIPILSREIADDGPAYNPTWYRVPDGYTHSGHLQLVRWEPAEPPLWIQPGGALYQVCVPFTRSYRDPDPSSDPLYRLYYQSTAWAEEVLPGADGRQWLRLRDDVLHIAYHVRAEHLRRVPAEELTPLSPEVPPGRKRIEVTLGSQELRAYEEDDLVLETLISSGIPDSEPRGNGVPTATPTGSFHVSLKTPLRHMGNGHVTSSLDAYELPGVPWVSFFHETGIGFHGTYWHNDFGTPKSHGCINMRTEEALWVYRWTLPEIHADQIVQKGRGTLVLVR